MFILTSSPSESEEEDDAFCCFWARLESAFLFLADNNLLEGLITGLIGLRGLGVCGIGSITLWDEEGLVGDSLLCVEEVL